MEVVGNAILYSHVVVFSWSLVLRLWKGDESMDPQTERQLADWAEEIDKAVRDDSLPTLYFNSFINTMGSGDVLLILKRGDLPVAKLYASYTVAKTLSVKLAELVGSLERATHNTIMTTDEVSRAMGSRQRNE